MEGDVVQMQEIMKFQKTGTSTMAGFKGNSGPPAFVRGSSREFAELGFVLPGDDFRSGNTAAGEGGQMMTLTCSCLWRSVYRGADLSVEAVLRGYIGDIRTHRAVNHRLSLLEAARSAQDATTTCSKGRGVDDNWRHPCP